MGFMSQGAFGVEGSGEGAGDEQPAKRQKKDILRFLCIDGYADFSRDTLCFCSQETSYPQYVSEDFSEASEVRVDFDVATMGQIHSWFNHLRITCTSDRTLLNKLRIAAEFFVDVNLQNHIDDLLYRTHYDQLKIDDNTTYAGHIYQDGFRRIPHGKGKLWQGQMQKCIFKGDFSHGKNELGTEYTYYSSSSSRPYVTYEGSFVDDVKDGSGEEFYQDTSKLEGSYNGDFKNGKPYGNGKFFYRSNKILFDGNFVAGTDSGFASIVSGSGVIYDEEDGTKYYEGEVKNGKPHGKGKLFHTNDQISVDGNFAEGEANGFAVSYEEDGTKYYEGEVREGLRHGIGKTFYINKALKYDGGYVNDKREGEGTLFDEDKNIIYKGMWREDFFHGKGLKYHHDRSWVKGTFRDNLLEGNDIIEYSKDSKIIYKGSYKEDLRDGRGLVLDSQEELKPCLYKKGVLQEEEEECAPPPDAPPARRKNQPPPGVQPDGRWQPWRVIVGIVQALYQNS